MVKGYIYTIETAIAVSIIVISMVFILSLQSHSSGLDVPIVKMQGIEALEFLEQKDALRSYVSSGNIEGIRDELSDILPATLSFDVTICDTQCYGNIPADETVIAVDYYVAGYREAFFSKKVRLWMWGDLS